MGKPSKFLFLLLFLSALIVSFQGHETQATNLSLTQANTKIQMNVKVNLDGDAEFVKDEVIVGFRDDIDTASDVANDIIASNGGKNNYKIYGMNSIVVKITEDITLEEYIDSVTENSEVSYAEPNYIDHMALTPNDPDYDDAGAPSGYGYYQQWAFQTPEGETSYDGLHCEDASTAHPGASGGAWDVTTGSSSIFVAVLDTGIRYTHEDLDGPYESYGYDHVNDDNNPWDDNGHGTHVAGTITAEINNGVGGCGIAPGVTLFAEKIWNDTGSGNHAQMAAGINHAIDVANNYDADHLIINISGDGSHSTTKQNAIDNAWENGALIIAAAGNDNTDDTTNAYPAAYDNVIAVSAATWDPSTNMWYKADYSNYGDWITLTAPGGEDTDGGSDWDTGEYYVWSTYNGADDDYGGLIGTSMATPHVSGVAALCWSAYSFYNSKTVRYSLVTGAHDQGSPSNNWDGAGIVCAYTAATVLIPEFSAQTVQPIILVFSLSMILAFCVVIVIRKAKKR